MAKRSQKYASVPKFTQSEVDDFFDTYEAGIKTFLQGKDDLAYFDVARKQRRWHAEKDSFIRTMDRIRKPCMFSVFRHLSLRENLLVIDVEVLNKTVINTVKSKLPFDVGAKFSGRRGVHLWVPSKTPFYTRDVKRMLLSFFPEFCKQKIIDANIYSKEHLIRCLNSYHEKSGLFSISIRDKFHMEDAKVPQPFELPPPVDVREWLISELGEEVVGSVEISYKGAKIENIDLPPCCNFVLKESHPIHAQRILLVLFLREHNWDSYDICAFIDRHNSWEDYDLAVTKRMVDSLDKYDCASCRTLRQKGLCMSDECYRVYPYQSIEVIRREDICAST